jgi:hypothetical protein
MRYNGTKAAIDFSDYIADRTEGFTGREWVFSAINDWLARSDGPRFFVLTGEPGSGKTAVAGRLDQFSQGENRPPEDLTSLTPKFLSAVYFCSARDRLWIDPRAFAESLALQLASRFPAYAEALAEKSGDQQIYIEVEQNVQHMEGGQVAGVVMKNLEVKGGTPEDAFTRLVREPLEAVIQGSHDEQLVILVDALDEALLYSGEVGIVSLLTQAKYLPSKVRFIVTSRPEVEVLRPLRRIGAEPRECWLTAGMGLSQSLEDVKRHVWRTLDEQPQLADKLASDLSQQDFAAAMQERSEGNFLYVRYLLQMLKSPQQETISGTSLEQLPIGLDGIYVEFLERLVGDDEEAWQGKYAPVTGTLAVAQQVLSAAQLSAFVGMSRSEVRTVLKDLRQFLETDDSLPASQRTYTIYHRSFGDFLLDEDRSEEYWCEEQEQHRRIVEYYRRGATSWDEIDWGQADGYGLRHLAYHLREAGYKQELYALLTGSPAWMDHKFTALLGHTSYVADLDLAISDFADPSTAPGDVLKLVKLHAARRVVNDRVTSYGDIDLQTLIWLGRDNEALAHARLRTNPWSKFAGLLAVSKTLKEKKNQADTSLCSEALEVAGTIPGESERAEALAELLMAATKAGDENQTSAVLPRAQKAADAIFLNHRGASSRLEEYRKRSKTLSALASALALAGDGDRADTLFREMRILAGRLQLESNQQSVVLSQLARGLARAGRYEEAQEVINDISDEGSKSEALAELAAALARAGSYSEALRVYEAIPPDGTGQ